MGGTRRVRAVALVLLMLGIPDLARAQSERDQSTTVSAWTFDRDPAEACRVGGKAVAESPGASTASSASRMGMRT